jgi:hypothetical protein
VQYIGNHDQRQRRGCSDFDPPHPRSERVQECRRHHEQCHPEYRWLEERDMIFVQLRTEIEDCLDVAGYVADVEAALREPWLSRVLGVEITQVDDRVEPGIVVCHHQYRHNSQATEK